MQNRKQPYASRICDEGLALDEEPADRAKVTPPFRHDDWAARQRVRSVVRELRKASPTPAASTTRTRPDRSRLDPPPDLLAQLEQATVPGLATSAPLPSSTAALQNRNSGGSQIMAWLIVVAGMLVLGAGLAIIAWSLSSHQMQYWNLALGLALGGQGTLILGLVLVISRLWRASRHAAARLQEVHTRLGQLQQASESLAAMRTTGAPAFYADLVRGASPHVLLANLKGQVDQLATGVGSW